MKYQTIKEQLADSSRALADLTVQMIVHNSSLLKDFLELSGQEEYPWCQRASRIISLCGCERPELIKPYLTVIINQLCNSQSESVRRNYLKIFVDVDFRLKERERSSLLNLCFDFLNGESSIGVKVYSMDILYKLCRNYPELLRELSEIVENQLPGSSPGFRSRGSKVIEKIRKELDSNSRIKGIVEDR
jgi:hypothetical protein